MILAVASLCVQAPVPPAEIAFERICLTDVFYSEGASHADLNRDGHGDVISGPYWYQGPSFERRFAIYEPRAFDPVRYSDNFFCYPHDFDEDGWTDVLFVGFPGAEARLFQNPGRDVASDEAAWGVDVVFDVVDNESPAFADLTGDGRPELVFHTGGRLGWASYDPTRPGERWRFHPLSPDLGLQKFTHGLGVGDVDGDGRADVLEKNGWWKQPASLDGDPSWERHPFRFAELGGAQMHVYDVNGDGASDVVTSLAAHHFGLAWFEQRRDGDRIDFVRHLILGEELEQKLHGVQFGELHALDLADVNRDGLLDLITGKRWWSHGAAGDPDPESGAVAYWFELVRDAGEARFVPHLIDDDSGVGTQVVAADVDGDERVDVVVGNKKGTFVLRQRELGQPRIAGDVIHTAQDASVADPGFRPLGDDGRPLNLDFETGDLTDWVAADDAFGQQPVRGDAPAARFREASRHQGDYWIGGYEKLGDEPVGTLTSAAFTITHPYASFLVGGGHHDETRVELRDAESDALIHAFSGVDYESMQRVVLDLREQRGTKVRLVLRDEAREGWGHVNYDDFRFHDHEPSFEHPGDIPRIKVVDVVRHSGLTPKEAAAAMDVPEGFRLDLIASEPDLHQPVAFAIDAKNRIWVAEAFEYPLRNEDGDGRDTLVVFEDEDHDGSFETRTVFADDLNLVSGFEIGFGGVWVGAAPHLLFIPDRNDDLVPDGPPEIVLDGWGYEDTHETLNAFIWGPDGWLYGCHGVFTHSRVGAPGTPDEEREPINAGVWRFHPTRREFEVFAWGSSNPWGVVFDERGQAFITACVIPHLFHMVHGGRYLRQSGEHFNENVFEDIQTIADHRHYVGDVPHEGNNVSNSAGGGHAHCGAMIYRGGAFPPEYDGALFMNNVHGNRVNVDVFERDGSGFVGKHADDFLVANDTWFRGINLKTGPDGAVYLIDWYDGQACHSSTSEIWDRSNGRLYRVAYGDLQPVRCDLRARSSDELIDLQRHSNAWFADRARLVLQERGPSPEVHARLSDELSAEPDEALALRLLWSLHVTGGLGADVARESLDSRHEYVRAWAVQLACEGGEPTEAIEERLVEMAQEDPSPSVRLYLASEMQRVRDDVAWSIGERLLAHEEDADDPNLPYLIWYGLEPLVSARPQQALELSVSSKIDRVARFLVRRVANEPACIGALVTALVDEADPERRAWMLEEMSTALEDELALDMPEGWPALYGQLAQDSEPQVREQGLWLAVTFGDSAAFPELRATLVDAGASVERRERALDALVRGRDPSAVEILHALAATPGPLRGGAIRSLANFDDPRTAERLLAIYSDLDVEEARDAINTMASRPSWARELIAAVQRDQVARADVGAFALRTLDSHRDAELDAQLGELWMRRPTPEAAAARIAELNEALGEDVLEAADLANGRLLFAKSCAQCHTLFDTGGTLAPELTGSNRADLDYLLTNLVDPNAVIGKDYQVTIAWLHDGRVISGIEKARTDTAVTLESENETAVIALDEIEELQLSELSTMPEGLLDAFEIDEIRDLVGYLQSPEQVALPLTEPEAFFDGRTLTGWEGDTSVWSVRDGEIVGQTEGLERNTWLRSVHELGDFHLKLEVLLVGNAGNSGIQFRSESDEHGVVSGYQADIGAGWWGKLYEEHGRALLWRRSGEKHVNEGEWNRYEIRAVGHHIQTWINGEPCVDLEDPDGALRGIVALQVHSGGPTVVRFRNFELELDPQ